jgi:hypothetical protein
METLESKHVYFYFSHCVLFSRVVIWWRRSVIDHNTITAIQRGGRGDSKEHYYYGGIPLLSERFTKTFFIEHVR